MKAIRVTKLKVTGTDFGEVSRKYLLAANWLSAIVFKTKELNAIRLHKAYYATIREKFKIGSQLTCSLCRQVSATYKTAKALNRWKLSIFRHPAIPIVWNRDFAQTKRGLTVWGNVVTLQGKVPEKGWKDSKLIFRNKEWYLLLSYEIEVPEPKAEGSIVGVDLGIKRLFVATNSANSKTIFFKSSELNHIRTCIRRTRASVQAVGSRASRRLLSRQRRHEAAVTEQMLHVASKALVAYAVSCNARKIVFEDLTNIRDDSFSKGKDLRSKINRWPYASFQFKTKYKAEAVGIEIEYVSPKDTSRGCPRCGHVSASNRKGLYFCCQKCSHQADADRNASENIRVRSVSKAHNAFDTGSGRPPQSSELMTCNSNHVVFDIWSVLRTGSRLKLPVFNR